MVVVSRTSQQCLKEKQIQQISTQKKKETKAASATKGEEMLEAHSQVEIKQSRFHRHEGAKRASKNEDIERRTAHTGAEKAAAQRESSIT